MITHPNTHVAHCPIDFANLPWRDRSDVFNAPPMTVLKCYLSTGPIHMHVVAFRVAIDADGLQTAFGGPGGDAGDADQHFVTLHGASGGEGHVETVEIGEYEYAVFLSPFCT